MTESDAALVARVLRGDADAFEALVRRHFRSAYLVALARVGEPAEAEDVCQEALFRAWDRIRECRDPERFGAWLVRITRNLALNRRAYLALRSTEVLEDTTAAAPGGAGLDLARNELGAGLHAALAHLSTVQREVVLLHDLEGWKHGAVAESLGISEVMSRRHLSDARRQLRILLGDFATLMPDHD
jgi:RNA polymerase sigma-70 factor (ECF subfamily)